VQMNYGNNSDRGQYRQRQFGRGAAHTQAPPAHGAKDRFGKLFNSEAQGDSVPSQTTVVGRMGESVGSYGSNQAVVNYQPFDATIPIRQVNPYTPRWAILGRCTARAEIRKFTNSSGESQVFSFDLIDADQSEIRCTIFGEAVNSIYPRIEIGHIYQVARGQVNKRSKYCNLDHEFEIRLDNQSVVDEVPEASIEREIPFITYKV